MKVTSYTPPQTASFLTAAQALAISKAEGKPLVCKSEFATFDIAFPVEFGGHGVVCTSYRDLDEALGALSFAKWSDVLVFAPQSVNIQCVLCEGSGERVKWDACPECDGRCEVQYSDGDDSYGYPIWVSQLCRSCGGAGGAEKVYRCGFCEGAGFVEVAESALMESDLVVQKGLAVAV